MARLSISTPEDVDLELELAGVASRVAAGVVDVCLFATVALTVMATLGAAGVIGIRLRDLVDVDRLTQLGPAVLALAASGLWFAHFFWFFAFEWLGHGQTPAKRWLGLRVVKDGGHAIGATAALVRSLLRLADFLPFFYLTGVLSIVASRHRRRLGDFAAGTLVIRHAAPVSSQRHFPGQRWTNLDDRRFALSRAHLDKLDHDVLDTLESYFDRADAMEEQTKAKLTATLAQALAKRADIPLEDAQRSHEDLLKELYLALRERVAAPD